MEDETSPPVRKAQLAVREEVSAMPLHALVGGRPDAKDVAKLTEMLEQVMADHAGDAAAKEARQWRDFYARLLRD
jgi:hypothetical protein